MKYLADTHILLWIMEEDLKSTKLSKKALDILNDDDTELYYSFINVWEVALKNTRHPTSFPYNGRDFEKLCRESGFELLETKPMHAIVMGELVYDLETAGKEHKDPYDRILLAQAKSEGLKFLTHDRLIPFYNEDCIVKV